MMHTTQATKENSCRGSAGGGWRDVVVGRHSTVERYATKPIIRKGYTLLELMIALGLLGALMSVAWSLMATFQIAEQRGWKMTQRTQIIRAAHDWLQSDAQQLITQSPERIFTGTSLGFTTLIAPALDPLPFLERLMTDSTASDGFDSGGTLPASVPLNTTGLASGASSLVDPAMTEALDGSSPWNQARLEIEYQLLPMPTIGSSVSTSSQVQTEALAEDELQFMLVRRQMVSGALPDQSNGSLDDPQSMPASERVLSGQDLYRQTDEEQISSGGIAISESRLEGLVRPQFQYSDGRSWASSWNSRSAGGLPVAVALRFDFPARAQMQPRPPRRSSDPLDPESELGLGDVASVSAADMALAGEAQAELQTDTDASLMESEEFEVQMVILLNRQPQAARSEAASQGNPFGSEAFGNEGLNSVLDYDSDFPLIDPNQALAPEVQPRTEISRPSRQGGSPGSRRTEQGNREQRDGF